jgi:hypothetical protein
VASDDFGAASSPLPAPWATVGSFNQLRAVSGACQNVTGGSDSANRYSTSTELSSQVTVATIGSTVDGGPMVCVSSDGDGYMAVNFDGSVLRIYRLDNGGFTEIGNTSSAEPGAGDTFRLRRSGNNLVASVAGADLVTVADTTYMTGNPGIFIFAGDLVFDDWTDGAAGGAAALSIAPILQNYRNMGLMR